MSEQDIKNLKHSQHGGEEQPSGSHKHVSCHSPSSRPDYL